MSLIKFSCLPNKEIKNRLSWNFKKWVLPSIRFKPVDVRLKKIVSDNYIHVRVDKNQEWQYWIDSEKDHWIYNKIESMMR